MKKWIVALAAVLAVSLVFSGLLPGTGKPAAADPEEIVSNIPPTITTPPPGGGGEDPGDGAVKIDETHFPDDVFRAYIEKFDKDEDGFLSAEEIKKVTAIDVRGTKSKSCGDLKGIEYFTYLKTLNCYGDNGKRGMACDLDLSKNTKLESIGCHNTNIKSLKIGKNTKLTKLVCYNTKLTKLDLSKCTGLRLLNCSECNLKSLNVSGCKNLASLQCDHNVLTELDVSACKSLTRLLCDHNRLKKLSVKSLKSLSELNCSYNKLTTLTLTGCKSLKVLQCIRNSLKKIDITSCTYLLKLVKNGERESAYSTCYRFKSGENLLEYDKSTKLIKK